MKSQPRLFASVSSAASVSTALLAFAPGFVQAAPIPGQGSWETTLQARDLDGNQTVDAYYDTALNITWFADVAAAKGSTFTDDSTGRMTRDHAVAWTASLSAAGGGWHLPVLLSQGFLYPSGSSQLAHLYTFALGNTTQHFPDVPVASGFENTANFINAMNAFYWLAPPANPNDTRTAFLADVTCGYDGLVVPSSSAYLYAWAVHDGDVGTPIANAVSPVPEPATWALLAGGLVAVVLRRRPAR